MNPLIHFYLIIVPAIGVIALISGAWCNWEAGREESTTGGVLWAVNLFTGLATLAFGVFCL